MKKVVQTKRPLKARAKTGTKFKIRKILTRLLEERIKDKLTYLDVFPKEDGGICRFFPMIAIWRRLENDPSEFPEGKNEISSKARLRDVILKMVAEGEIDYVSGKIRGGENLYALKRYKDQDLDSFLIDVKQMEDVRKPLKNRDVLDP